MYRQRLSTTGFTIVELLIVIIVIAILATITIIAYNGIIGRSQESVVKSDLQEALTQLKLAHVETGTYPADTDNIKKSDSVTFTGYTSDTNTFCLEAINNQLPGSPFHVTDVGQVESGGCEIPIVATSISAGELHTCAVVTGGKAYCWGRDSYGQLGDGNTTTSVSTPIAVLRGAIPDGVTIKSVSLGQSHTCVIASDDKAYCWGYNGSGRLGDGTTTQRTTPVAVSQGAMPDGATIKSISSGGAHTCAIASDDKAYCWGLNSYGRLGDGTTTQRTTPVAVLQGDIPNGVTIKSIASGAYSTCIVGSNNKAYCWGYGADGALGNGTNTDSSSPVSVSQGSIPPGDTFKSISVGGVLYACTIASNDKAYCWGRNDQGQLGDGTTTNRNTPVAVLQGDMPSGGAVKGMAFMPESYHVCVIASDDKAYCWGRNSGIGQLGDGTTTNRNTPVAVLQGDMPSGATIKYITTGLYFTCAIASDDKVYCWGANDYGQFGNGTTSLMSNTTPVVALPF